MSEAGLPTKHAVSIASVGAGTAASIDDMTALLFREPQHDTVEDFDQWCEEFVRANDENASEATLVDQAAACFFGGDSESESGSDSDSDSDGELEDATQPQAAVLAWSPKLKLQVPRPPKAASVKLTVPNPVAGRRKPAEGPKPLPARAVSAARAALAEAAEAEAAGAAVMVYASSGRGFPCKRTYRQAHAIPLYLEKRARRKWEAQPMYATRTNAAHKRSRSNGKFSKSVSYVSASQLEK